MALAVSYDSGWTPVASSGSLPPATRKKPTACSYDFGPIPLTYEKSNDSLFYPAVEKDSLIAVLWHFWSFVSFGCL